MYFACDRSGVTHACAVVEFTCGTAVTVGNIWDVDAGDKVERENRSQHEERWERVVGPEREDLGYACWRGRTRADGSRPAAA